MLHFPMKRLALSLPILASCMAAPPQEGGDWRTSDTFDKPYDEVWSACLQTLENKGWKFKEEDKLARRIVTEWKTQMSPRPRESTREMMELMIVNSDKGKGLVVKVKSTREINDNFQKPASEKDADWIGTGGNDALADEICYLLKLKINKPGLDD